MKITIDTKEDSHEEIKKAISLLSSILEKEKSFDVFESSPSIPSSQDSSSTGLFGMFNNSDNNNTASAVGTDNILKQDNLNVQEKEKEEDLELETY